MTTLSAQFPEFTKNGYTTNADGSIDCKIKQFGELFIIRISEKSYGFHCLVKVLGNVEVSRMLSDQATGLIKDINQFMIKTSEENLKKYRG